MVSCNEFLAEFGNYLEGDVSAELRRELELHLAQCSTCQVIVDSTTKTVRIVTDAGEFDLSERISEPIVSKIMDRVRPQGGTEAAGERDDE